MFPLHHQSPPRSSSSSSRLLLLLFTRSPRLLRTGTRERLAPPRNASKSQAGERVHSGLLKQAGQQPVSSSPLPARIHWTFQGGGGFGKILRDPSDSWCHTTECWPWTCPVCLPVCLTVILLCVCLLHRLSICTKCHSVITFLQTLHWPPTTLMTSPLTVFTCTVEFRSRLKHSFY